MRDTPTGRRLCAHADDNGPMHFLDPGETCQPDTAAALDALREHLKVQEQIIGQLGGGSVDERAVVAWADTASEVAGQLRTLICRPKLAAVPDNAS